MQEPLIVGIDPGTTVGVAALDLHGDVVFLYSKKNVSLSEIIFNVIKHGKPLAVGTDVYPAPSFVKNFCSKVGAGLIVPDENVKVNEKRELTSHHPTKNTHEMDALASALIAFKEISPTINSIEKRLLKRNKIYHFYPVLELILRKKCFTVEEALRILEKKEGFEKKEIQKKLPDLKGLLKRVSLLEQENLDLKRSISFFMKQNKKEKELPTLDNNAKRRLDLREKRALTLVKEVETLEREKELLALEKADLEEFFMHSHDSIIFKQIPNLSEASLYGLNDKIVFVSDTNTFSLKAIDDSNLKTIFYQGRLNKVVSEKLFGLNSKEFNLKFYKGYARIKREELEEAIHSRTMVERVIKQYKEKRRNYSSNAPS